MFDQIGPFSTFDIYRPFGASLPHAAGLTGRITADIGGLSTHRAVQWSHRLDLDATADLRDGCTRTAGTNAIAYADGDEVRIDGIRYVVAWVETVHAGSEFERKTAYLMRHA